MITATVGPLIVEPEYWILVFERDHPAWWVRLLAMGRYKHVRAYAYVPYLHVWVFYDVDLRGAHMVFAADGAASKAAIRLWTANSDLVRVRRFLHATRRPPVLGFCVPAIKRLIGLRTGALRPDRLYADVLAHGGEPFEEPHGIVQPVTAEPRGADISAATA